MKPHRLAIIIGVLVATFLAPAFAVQDKVAQEERITAAYLLALGRAPSASEIDVIAKDSPSSVAAAIESIQHRIEKEPALQQAISLKAFRDTYGREPSDGELLRGGDYTSLMNRYIEKLAISPEEYKHVLERAYRLVVKRGLYDEEIGYWKPYGTLPFALVVACLDEWARRNQPGLMVTTGTAAVSANCHYLTTVRLSPSVAEEARAALKFPLAPTSDYYYASNRTVITPGGEQIVSNGRVHFVAAGAPDLPMGKSSE
jgi:hypothetical protein